MNRMRFITLAAALAVAFGLTACGDSATPTPENEVSATLAEWSIALDKTTVDAGDVTFNATNGGAIQHELVVIRSDADPGSLTVTSEGKADEEEAGTTIGEIEPDELGPGDSSSATFNLRSGKYVLICNIPGHYQQGMFAGLTVQ